MKTGRDIGREGQELIEAARRTRRDAAAFRAVVERYCAEMPAHLDRFHDAMLDLRRTAESLRRGQPSRPPRHEAPQKLAAE